jgi:UDP-N-acetylglucosamine 2-epimerase (non-hydrolysing)
MVLGDTNTVPLFSLAARHARVPLVHLEAGLRSFNASSAEETNRRIAGALACLHFAPTQLAAKFLRAEGIEEARIHVVGNPIIDVLATSGRGRVPVTDRAGAVVTAHRATNVDDPLRLAELARLVAGLADRCPPVIFPVHPRTRQRLDESGLSASFDRPDVRLLAPVAWDTMLDLVSHALIVVTDSGGLQEEASYFGVPVVVLRRSTPRWEGVEAGTSVLTGLRCDAALDAVATLTEPGALEYAAAAPCPYGDGRTSERVADVLLDPATGPLLDLSEPDLDAPARFIVGGPR